MKTDTSQALQNHSAYYNAIAREYEEHQIDVPGANELLAAIDSFPIDGSVLELACGPGTWTGKLIHRSAVTEVTALDGSAEMLAIAKARWSDPRIKFVRADLFRWIPTQRFDVVFFGFWISHVPDELFNLFWESVELSLKPGGRVFFFDDSHRPEYELIHGADSAIIERKLHSGEAFEVIKVPYDSDELEQRLSAIGWNIRMHANGAFYWVAGTRQPKLREGQDFDP